MDKKTKLLELLERYYDYISESEECNKWHSEINVKEYPEIMRGLMNARKAVIFASKDIEESEIQDFLASKKAPDYYNQSYLALWKGCLSSQGVIKGRVINKNGKPVKGARIEVAHGESYAESNDDGVFTMLGAEEGKKDIIAYTSSTHKLQPGIEIKKNQEVDLNFSLDTVETDVSADIFQAPSRYANVNVIQQGESSTVPKNDLFQNKTKKQMKKKTSVKKPKKSLLQKGMILFSVGFGLNLAFIAVGIGGLLRELSRLSVLIGLLLIVIGLVQKVISGLGSKNRREK